MKFPTIKLTFFSLALALAFGFSLPTNAAILIYEGGGQVAGATEVNVNGILYDVDFVDGTCAFIFSGCDEISDFTFNDEATANAASQALLDQVLIGQLDTHPAFVKGCDAPVTCDFYTPFSLGPDRTRPHITTVTNSFIRNWNSASLHDDGPYAQYYRSVNDDTTYWHNDDRVYTVWSVTTVPLPPAASLFMSSLIGLMGFKYRR